MERLRRWALQRSPAIKATQHSQMILPDLKWQRRISRYKQALKPPHNCRSSHLLRLLVLVLLHLRLFQRAGSITSIPTQASITIFIYPPNLHNGNFPRGQRLSISMSPCHQPVASTLEMRLHLQASARSVVSLWHLQDSSHPHQVIRTAS